MQLDLWRLVSGVGALLSRNSDLIASPGPRDIGADVYLSLLRGVPPVIACIAMTTAHYFIRAFHTTLGRYDMASP